jgi:hypothetical protein
MAQPNFYTKRQTDTPQNFLSRDGDQPKRIKAPQPTGEETVDNSGTNYGGNVDDDPLSNIQTLGGVQQIDISQPDVTQQVSNMIANGSLMRSPYYAKILENQQKLIALRAQPTYVNKRGETVPGMKDQDGRLQSGLKAVVERLSRMGPTPDWGSLAAGVAGAASAGVAGAIAPEWNEWADRNREIQRLEQENARMIGEQRAVSGLETQETNRNLASERVKIQQQQLQMRKARTDVQNLNDTQKTALEPIMRRGYYYEGDNPDEDAKLKGLGIILPDFDNSRKPVNDNGVRKAWNPQTRSYEPVEGVEADPDEQPMTFEVNGKQITASTKWFLNYAGAKERQESQQAFQREQQQRTFDQQNRIQAANQQMTANQLTERLTKYAGDNDLTFEQAKEAFKRAGVNVDEILKRQ